MRANKPSRYHPLQISLHWLVVLLIIAAFVLGKTMSRIPNEPAKLAPLAIHMTIGFLTLLTIIARFAARYRLPRPA
ncbi:MAG: cytochrome b/b6 domain-containing protein [Chloroflexota bacterium]